MHLVFLGSRRSLEDEHRRFLSRRVLSDRDSEHGSSPTDSPIDIVSATWHSFLNWDVCAVILNTGSDEYNERSCLFLITNDRWTVISSGNMLAVAIAWHCWMSPESKRIQVSLNKLVSAKFLSLSGDIVIDCDVRKRSLIRSPYRFGGSDTVFLK